MKLIRLPGYFTYKQITSYKYTLSGIALGR